MDLVVRTARFPEIGETIIGESFATNPGGKGANQAAAAGKLGGKPRFLAKVGADAFGRELLHSLGVCGVDTGSVIVDPTLVSGVAVITVDSEGRNTIVVSPGANGHLYADEVEGEIEEVGPEILLAQLEVPLEAVEAAAAKLPADKLFILNPAPARDLPDSLLQRVDYLTPNETETEFLTGIRPVTDEDCLAAADKLFAKGVRNVVITLGEHGCFLATPQFGQRFPTLEVRPVDTTAAGDAFNGALAFFLSEGRDIDNAILLANVVGALSTQKTGAQSSMPTMREVREAASELL
ncbi:ribokinase [Fimbriimonas ginsengisoli Gsoil 348]|uniref:Deoxyribokinase n=2 Tax=Fimbriimonas ginsengisoli TaxID=1005039 RepID=A0A068NY10_FIMGI|nr:ribokinase [Fimbriimonas ginsengisoli Gsoil 348]